MSGLLIAAVLVPWSIARQMHERAVTRAALVKMPAIFALIAAITLATSKLDGTNAVLAYLAASAVLAIGFGIYRGRRTTLWRDGDTPMQQGNRATLTAWIVMITLKIALGTVAAVTGWIPAESAGEIFAFLALTLAVQNLVVARRVSVPARWQGRRRGVVPGGSS